MTPAKRMQNRLELLQKHLEAENPVLVSIVKRYNALDKVAQNMGLLRADESYATQISWWPLVSVLGTFSAGKSSFINSYLNIDVQESGNQAVDDRFTVLSYGGNSKVHTLPGIALDSDPRFPFYQISEDIELVAQGEGSNIDNYLQMKIVPSEILRGKIIIDSPGFDADEQRKETLKITDHIIELSDLVLVLFDARHPEPGAMQDTLEHLVRGSQRRSDNSKFLFILNQIDTSANDDNMEDIVAAWKKALVQNGLSTGSFYVIFNDKLATPVGDEAVWARYLNKRNKDYAEINKRMEDINIERIYRIIGTLESLTNQLEQQVVPQIKAAKGRWKKRVIIADIIIFIPLMAGLYMLSVMAGYWQGFSFNPPWLASVTASPLLTVAAIGIALIIAYMIHLFIRGKLVNGVAKTLSTEDSVGNLANAFRKNTRWRHSVFSSKPKGWSMRIRKKLDSIRSDIDQYVQTLNDQYTSPSGKSDNE